MDWKSLGQKAFELGLPTLGSFFLGPAGGMAGKGLVSIVSGALGLDKAEPLPEEIFSAFQDPEKLLKAKEIDAQYKIRIEELVLEHSKLDIEKERLLVDKERLATEEAIKQISEVNATMREETKSEHWMQWSWRPYIGFITGTSFGFTAWRLCDAIMKAIGDKDIAFITQLPVIIGALVALFSVPCAILGVSALGRNKLKLAQAECAIKPKTEELEPPF